MVRQIPDWKPLPRIVTTAPSAAEPLAGNNGADAQRHDAELDDCQAGCRDCEETLAIFIDGEQTKAIGIRAKHCEWLREKKAQAKQAGVRIDNVKAARTPVRGKEEGGEPARNGR